MKHIYFFLLLFVTATSFAQLMPPASQQSYYTGVDFNKTGLDLFDDLAVKTAAKHTNALSYTPGIWEASRITDEDANNTNNVRLFYGYSDTDGNSVTDTTRDKNLNGGTSGTDWNREHVFPNSLASPDLDAMGTSGPPYADAHNLRPSDVQMNGNRGNRKFADGNGNAGNVSGNWYPGDEFKGDAARIIMYMYVRYGTQCLPRFATVGTVNSTDADMINLLLEWNEEDPVSPIEDARNSYHTDDTNTYGQGNRNPFIDNPFLATVIWGGTAAENRWGAQPPADTEAPSTPTNLLASNPTDTTVDLTWTASSDNVGVVAYQIYVDGTFYNTSNGTGTSFTVEGLNPLTMYSFTIRARDAATNSSLFSSASSETTIAGPATGTNCANETFENIPASNSGYLTRTWTGVDGIANGWTATDARTDQTINSRAILVRNGSLTSPAISGGIQNLTVTTQLTFGGGAGTFDLLVNGNSVGTIPYSGDNTMSTTTTISNINVAGNVTVVLDNNSSNRVRIDDLSWTCFSALGTADFSLNDIKIFPNPVNGNEVVIDFNQNIQVEVYDILGKKVKQQQITTNQSKLNIAGLKKGIYLLRLTIDSGTTTKKLIRQ